MADAPGALRAFARRYRMPLTRGLKGEDLDSLLRMHPLPDTWSALEYACHVRDVFTVQRERLASALTDDAYEAVPMRRDEIVTERGYNEQVPVAVVDDLSANADELAAAFAVLAPDQWDRTFVYHDQGPRTLTWVAQHTVHEAEHHLLDIGRVLRAARGR
jgi:S-DNA-T family DNA segregation ATPase FtsK/SpoIIIE